MAFIPPVRIDFTPQDNTTSCICCSSNVVSQNSRFTAAPVAEPPANPRMIPSGNGLIAEKSQKPSCLSFLDCFAEVRKLKANETARELFETFLTQQVGQEIATGVLSDHQWSKVGIPLHKNEVDDITAEALDLYRSTQGIAKAFRHREVADKLKEPIEEPSGSTKSNQPPSPSEKGRRPSFDFFGSNSKKSGAPSPKKPNASPLPMKVDRTTRKLREDFDPSRIANYIREISPASEEEASDIASQIQITFTYSHPSKPIESRDILDSVVGQLREKNITVKPPEEIPEPLRKYHHFKEIPLSELKKVSTKSQATQAVALHTEESKL